MSQWLNSLNGIIKLSNMTSSNTIEYSIYDKNNEVVGRHSQNIMCSRCNDRLLKFIPSEDFTIQAWGYDEEEDEWESEKINLKKWLDSNPAQFTFRNFQPDEKVKLTRKRGEAVIIETTKGKWTNVYKVQLPDGTILEGVNQNEVLPI